MFGEVVARLKAEYVCTHLHCHDCPSMPLSIDAQSFNPIVRNIITTCAPFDVLC